MSNALPDDLPDGLPDGLPDSSFDGAPDPSPPAALENLPDPLADLDADPALAAAVLEIEQLLAPAGWDQPARLYALVGTSDLVSAEPELAAQMGLDASAEQGSLTAIEQDQLAPDQQLEQMLESIVWPDAVTGCAVMVERLVLPPGADADLPDDPAAQRAFAAEHPDRQTVRIVAGAMREGTTYCALRLRAHDDAASVVGGVDLVPGLLDLLHSTLRDDPHQPDRTGDSQPDLPLDEETP